VGPGQRERPRPELGQEQPLDLADAVAEGPRQAGDPLAVDGAVGDEPDGAGGHVTAVVPGGDPGLASGRQRLQARNPARCADAAEGWNSTFSALGVTAGQLGRQ
jgi:hypothetical protein